MMPLLRAFEGAGRWGLRQNGFTSHWFDSSVGKMHFFRARGEGSLPPFVLLHGLGSSSLGYGPLMRELLPHTREIVALDTPAHGLSQLRHHEVSPATLFQGVQECLDALDIDGYTLVGNSLGGGMAMRYALYAPSRLGALVLMSPAGAPTPASEQEAFLNRFQMERWQDADEFTRRLLYKMPWYKPLIVSFIRTNFKRPHLKEFIKSVSGGVTMEESIFQPEELGELAVPACLIWGEADRIMPPSHFSFYKEHLPPETVIHTPASVGHSPQVEQPRMVSHILLSFLESPS